MNRFVEVFESVTSDQHYLRNLDWGEPRPGHPEGTIRAHIQELERNLERLRTRVSEVDLWRLRILVHVHDTFKPDAAENVAISHPRSHASIAAAFLREKCDDDGLQAMVQFHDEPFALWRQARLKGACDTNRFEALLTNITDWNLFLTFCIVDGCTAGKSREPLAWLFREIHGRVQVTITERDIL